MLQRAVVRLVELCTRHAWPVIVLSLALTCLSTVYAVQHFAIATDIRALFPRDLPWTQRAYEYLAAFPDRGILAVIDAPTPELADTASRDLTGALKADNVHFRVVDAPQNSEFFARNGLLFLPTDQVKSISERMGDAGPLLGALAADPSLRGALGAL